MKSTWSIIHCLLVTLVSLNLHAQDPCFFHYDDEAGLPSNEVYSIVQDKKGFIWFGSDAGLYKYDGVRYIPFHCSSQKSKSTAGLTVSSSGRLYCTNFQSQIFYVENDVLKELPHAFSSVLHITCDRSGNLLVNHTKGFAVYNETTKQWLLYTDFGSTENRTTRSVRVNAQNETCFLTATGIATYKSNRIFPINAFSGPAPTSALSADFMIEWFEDEQWIFPFSGQNKIYRCKNGQIDLVTNRNLIAALQGKTITNVKRLSDGFLWICTYTGIIRYNPKKDAATFYYPGLAFSDCLIDREGNYWFSTLQSGLIRVPNLNYTVWNNFQNNKLTRLTTDGTQLYFATVNGDIGSLNPNSNSLQFLQIGNNSSIQCLDYSPKDRCVYFYTNKNLYTLRNGKSQLLIPNAPPTKHITKIGDQYLICSSFGTYVYDFNKKDDPKKINDFWSREAKYDSKHNGLWVATNNGLLHYKKTNGTWSLQRTLFRDSQVLSLDFDPVYGQLFVVTVDGSFYAVQSNYDVRLLYSGNYTIRSYRLQHYKNRLYVATNQGVWIIDTKTRKKKMLNVFSGLASNNVQDLYVLDGVLWLSTGKGLQRIPLSATRATPRTTVYLKDNRVDPELYDLGYGDVLILHPEATTYSSNGKFEYAYRINGARWWTKLPGSIEQIELQHIPSGDFKIELKVIDHLNQDSENTILVKGYMAPPFWQTWWFLLVEILVFLLVVYFIFKRQLTRRQKELLHQNQLNEMKLTAIRSQMNPHFIFNVLSSIKGYIYENDRQKATTYLDDFSDLMRSILEMSEVHYNSIADELKTLKLYIDLEAMMLEEFTCEIVVDEQVDPHAITLPSLLLQPYIENAFKHGLRHKAGEKLLTIRVFLSEAKQLTIEITDNGIGRTASSELNRNNALKPQSFATQALEKRITLINRQSMQQIRLEIVDLYKENGSSAGTSVVLTFFETAL